MNKKIGMRVNYYERHSDRIIIVKIDTKPTPTTVVQVYMPTSSVDDEEIEVSRVKIQGKESYLQLVQ